MKRRHYFAPGTIERTPEPTRAWVWTDFVGALALMVAAYFVAGWLV